MNKKTMKRLMSILQVIGSLIAITTNIAYIRTGDDMFNSISLFGVVLLAVGSIYLSRNKEVKVKKQTSALYRAAVVAAVVATLFIIVMMYDVIKNFDITATKTQLFIAIIAIIVGLLIYINIAYKKAPLLEMNTVKGDVCDGEEEAK